MTMRIERITDEEGARAFYDLDQATTAVDHPGLVPEPLEAIIGMLPNPTPSFTVAFYLGTESGDVVASAFFGLPQVDNTHTCFAHVTVALDARRRGHGTQLASFLFDEARAAGRTKANWNTGSPLDATSPGDLMSEKLGAVAALESIRRELRLGDLDRARLELQLKALTEGPAADYELRTWRGRCPDDLAEGAARIIPIVMSDSPRGELDIEPEVWDVARFREHETMLAARQRDTLSTAAVQRGTGRMVAMTDLNVPLLEHRVVSQMGTAVEPAHRGRRLGLAVKLANVLALIDAYPDAQTVQTINAAENEHMVAVNTKLGFRAVERSRTWQLDL